MLSAQAENLTSTGEEPTRLLSRRLDCAELRSSTPLSLFFFRVPPAPKRCVNAAMVECTVCFLSVHINGKYLACADCKHVFVSVDL